MNSLVSPPRNGGPRPLQAGSQELRNTLPTTLPNFPRRFTADSGRVPTLSTIGSQRLPDTQEYPTAVSPAKDVLALP